MTRLPSKERVMRKGFTLVEVMAAIATLAVLIALLLPDIQQIKDVSLNEKKKAGPYWVYREYKYAGGPVTTEISGSYRHSLQEILDMYAINLKKEQERYSRELNTKSFTKNEAKDRLPKEQLPKKKSTLQEEIKDTKRVLKNLKSDLTKDTTTLVARRNITAAISSLNEHLGKLESKP